jgi:hypothetical protein
MQNFDLLLPDRHIFGQVGLYDLHSMERLEFPVHSCRPSSPQQTSQTILTMKFIYKDTNISVDPTTARVRFIVVSINTL